MTRLITFAAGAIVGAVTTLFFAKFHLEKKYSLRSDQDNEAYREWIKENYDLIPKTKSNVKDPDDVFDGVSDEELDDISDEELEELIRQHNKNRGYSFDDEEEEIETEDLLTMRQITEEERDEYECEHDYEIIPARYNLPMERVFDLKGNPISDSSLPMSLLRDCKKDENGMIYVVDEEIQAIYEIEVLD